MSATWMWSRARFRSERAAIAVLILVVGIAATVVLTSITMAVRTGSAFDRMVEANETADAVVNPSEGDGSGLTAAVLATVPGVERVGRLDAAMVVSPGPTTIQSFDESPVLLVPSGGVGDDFHRSIVDTGRLPDPAEVEEIFVERWWADANDVEVGDRIPMTALTSDDMGTAYEAVDSGAEIPQMGTPIEFTVVGIGGNEGSIAYNADFEPLPWIGTPAYWDRYDEPSAGFGIFPVQLEAGVSAEDLRRGISDLDLRIPEEGKLEEELEPETVAVQSLSSTREAVERVVGPQVVALWAFAGIALFVGVVVVGQALGRRVTADAADDETLDAMGMTRRDRFAGQMIRLAAIGVGGALVAGVLTVVLSPLGPIGSARLAETAPGIFVEPMVLVIGVLATFAAVLALGAWPAWRSTRAIRRSRRSRTSHLASAVAAAGGTVAAVTGVRFALEPGGRRRVPTRSTLFGAATAVAVVATVVTFAASLDHLVETPRLYGAPTDTVVSFTLAGEADEETIEQLRSEVHGVFERDPGVSAWSEVAVDEVRVGGRTLTAVSFGDSSSPVAPVIREGRPPSAPDEVALGSGSMDDLGASLGGTVEVGGAGDRATVVGVAVLPAVGTFQAADKAGLGDGALFTEDGLKQVGSGFTHDGGFAVTISEGTSAELLQRIEAAGLPPILIARIGEMSLPPDISALEDLRSTPIVLAGLLVAVLAATVVHALLSSFRRRRHDVAVLRVIGMQRSQVVRTSLWQATTIAVISSAIGLPLGLIVGRWLWISLAELMGAFAIPVAPVGLLIALVVMIVVSANLVGLVPGWRLANRNLADPLRTE